MCFSVSCLTVFLCIMFYCFSVCFTVLHCIMFYCVLSCLTVFYCIMSLCVSLYHVLLCCTVSYFILFRCINVLQLLLFGSNIFISTVCAIHFDQKDLHFVSEVAFHLMQFMKLQKSVDFFSFYEKGKMYGCKRTSLENLWFSKNLSLSFGLYSFF